MNKDEIKAILNRHFLNRGPSYNPLDELDAAAKAIAALPVDRVQAMALFVYASDFVKNRYYLPDGYTVDRRNEAAAWFCKSELPHNARCADGGCKHTQAVELYRARQ